jgi:hypothetical protein
VECGIVRADRNGLVEGSTVNEFLSALPIVWLLFVLGFWVLDRSNGNDVTLVAHLRAHFRFMGNCLRSIW